MLFKILNDRVYGYLESKGFFSFNQTGFTNKCRTEDNIFVLHTIFQKYVHNKKKKLYIAFIDFRKYFDTINREGLLSQ